MTGRKQSFVLMDCTLRDGGFQTDWRFSDAMARQYFDTCQAMGVDMVELGYLNLAAPGTPVAMGSYKALPESLSEQQRELVKPGTLRAAVMIDAWRILDLPTHEVAQVILSAVARAPFRIEVLRIAAMSSQLDASFALAQVLAESDLAVMINLMQVAELSPEQLAHDLRGLGQVPIQAFYFADSFGRMLPEQVHRVLRQAGELTDLPLGFHAHDNYGLAVANTHAALQAGARYVDGTFAGIGRAAGNAPTETLALLKPGQQEMASCERFLAEHIEPLRQEASWGYSPTYRCQAKHNVHPTYAQKLFEGAPLSALERIDILGRIAGHAGAGKYDPSILNHYM